MREKLNTGVWRMKNYLWRHHGLRRQAWPLHPPPHSLQQTLCLSYSSHVNSKQRQITLQNTLAYFSSTVTHKLLSEKYLKTCLSPFQAFVYFLQLPFPESQNLPKLYASDSMAPQDSPPSFTICIWPVLKPLTSPVKTNPAMFPKSCLPSSMLKSPG